MVNAAYRRMLTVRDVRTGIFSERNLTLENEKTPYSLNQSEYNHGQELKELKDI